MMRGGSVITKRYLAAGSCLAALLLFPCQGAAQGRGKFGIETLDGRRFSPEPPWKVQDEGEFLNVAGSRLRKEQIKSVSGLGPVSVLDVFRHRERKLKEGDADVAAWRALAAFTVGHDLLPEAHRCFSEVLRRSPGDEAVKKAIQSSKWAKAWWDAAEKEFVVNAKRIEAEGRAHFVAPKGDDTAAGTKNAPWASLRRAWEQARPGDVIFLRGGECRWKRRVELRGGGGAPGRPVTIAAYPGEKVVLRSNVLFWNSSAHFRVIGIEFAGASLSLRDASFADIVGCHIHHYGGAYHGIGTAGGGRRIRLINNHVHHCGRPGNNLDHGIYIGGGTNVLLRGNRVHDNAAYGIHIYSESGRGKGYVIRVRVEGKEAYNQRPRAGIIAAGQVDDVTIRGNHLHNSSCGIQIAYRAGLTRVEDNRIENCNIGIRLLGLREPTTVLREPTVVGSNSFRNCKPKIEGPPKFR